jgi:hypothetical protein
MSRKSPNDTKLSGKYLTCALIVWIAAVGITVILSLLTFPTYIQIVLNLPSSSPFDTGQSPFPIDKQLLLINHFVVVVATLFFGVLIAIRLPRDRMGLLASAVFIIYALAQSSPRIAVFQEDLQTQLLILVAWVSITAMFYVYLVFPTGRMAYPWLVLPVVCVALYISSIGGQILGNLTEWIVLALWLATLGLVVYRYRQTHDLALRQQLKWAVIGLCVITISVALVIFTLPIENYLSSMGTGPIWFEVQTRGFEFIPNILSLAGPMCLTIALLRTPKHTKSVQST